MATFVLVHGSFHGAWCWRKVAPLLRARGHDVWTPTLTGFGDRSHLRAVTVDLSLHCRDVLEMLEAEDVREAVLVGHSYAGMIIASVAATAPQRLQSLVYLDAYLPRPGECELDLWPAEEAAAARKQLEEDPAAMRAPLSAAAFGITDPEEARWVDARLRPQPLATYAQPVPPARAPPLPGAFVHCTEEWPLASRFALMAARARALGWPVHELRTGHDAMLTTPIALADVLERCSAQSSHAKVQ